VPAKINVFRMIGAIMLAGSQFTGAIANEVQPMTSADIPGISTGKWVLVIHGGGSSNAVTPERETAITSGLKESLTAGSKVLGEGGTALDAVEAAVRVLENDITFNAGRGAKMTIDGGFELDASIMCGRTLRSGGVAIVRTVANPVSLARAVMDRTNHLLLGGDGAEAFAKSIGIPVVDQSYFFNQRAFDSNNATRVEQGLEPLPNPAMEFSRGTVGAVAMDSFGNVAAATSTGGRTGKMNGRIGDSPIVGAGNYARNDVGAISCTGYGEEFIRHQAAFQTVLRARVQGISLESAVDHVLNEELPTSAGGMIGVTPSGDIVMRFTTKNMSRGYVTSDGKTEVAIRAAD
jgi:beta-aspartyl-peptidase (threonine type)